MHNVSNNQCDHFGLFLKGSLRQICCEKYLKIRQDLGYFEKCQFKVKTTVATTPLGKMGLFFIPTSGHTGNNSNNRQPFSLDLIKSKLASLIRGPFRFY